MVFSSLVFLYIFLPLCLIFYFAVKDIKVRNAVLLVFSLVFYAYGEPKYIFLMVATVLVDYIGGLLVGKFKGKFLSKLFLALSVLITLASLGLFKYSDFFAQSLNSAFSLEIKPLGLALPIGISFYTFQALTYVVDVYREKVKVQKSFFDLLLYVSMFPQLIAGPIVRYSDVEKQISERDVSFEKAAAGIVRFSVGLLKKTLIANYAGELTAKLIGGDMQSVTFIGAFVGISAYTIQIYFDFSAYSDMAIGLGKIFGFDFPENFNYPYCAQSVNDFWRRWHITLSSFFRDYVYISLGGNRKRWALNMLIVWTLTGIWHGASYNYILWGLYYFFFLMLEKIYIADALKRANFALRHIYTMAVVIIGWAFFYFEDLEKLKLFFAALTLRNGFVSLTEKTVALNYIAVIAVGILASLPFAKIIKRFALNLSEMTAGKIAVCTVSAVFVLFSLTVSTASLIGDSYNPFLYFRF